MTKLSNKFYILLFIILFAISTAILLPGVAWRTYFFLSILPHAVSLWKRE